MISGLANLTISSPREYSLVLLGATGYTGRLCAEYITKHLPTNLKWAVAGRSSTKLQGIVDNIKKLNPDRAQPGVLLVNLDKQELDILSRQTKVLLNCIGPYHRYSTPIVAVCAGNGTHYLDVTGETAWVREVLHKYEDVAKANKAIIIPEVGVESTPSDLVAYTIATTIRRTLNCGVREVVCSLHEMKTAGPSGGSLATALGILDQYSLSEVRASSNPFALSPLAPPKRPSSRSALSRLLGPFFYPNLGILTTSIMSQPNVAIVHRSAGMRPQLYGNNFRFREYTRASNYVTGILLHWALTLATLFVTIKPLRHLIRRFVYQPGQGPSEEESAKDALEFRAIGVADEDSEGKDKSTEKKAMARLRYEGGMYHFTGLALAEAAMVLLENEGLVKELGGGFFTPASLGDPYVERLQKAGVGIDSRMVS